MPDPERAKQAAVPEPAGTEQADQTAEPKQAEASARDESDQAGPEQADQTAEPMQAEASARDESDQAAWVRRGSSFGAAATAYAEHRPDYPDAAVAWALRPVRGRSPLRVLDIGAGTGKLTRTLARLADEVVAVEPDSAMLAELRRQLPGVRSLAGAAEQIPLPDGSVDAVFAGQAAHWFDLPRAIPEIGRVLAVGGVAAGLWNVDDDRVGWVAGLADVCAATATLSRWDQARAYPGADADWHTARPDLFAPAEEARFEHWQLRTADLLVATIATHSHQLVMEPDQRAELLARAAEYLRSCTETAGEFRLPLVTAVLRLVRI
jgi:SAM-dependent methyltransferase